MRRETVQSYKDLEVWQLSVELAAATDALAEKLTRARRFSIADQLCRSALSVSSNIAEGSGRVHRLEFAHHVAISRGSLFETESILYVAIRCAHLTESECAPLFRLIQSIGRMLTRLLQALYRTHPNDTSMQPGSVLNGPSFDHSRSESQGTPPRDAPR